MTKSQKLTVTEGADGAITVAKKDSEILDIPLTVLSTDTVITGTHGLIQRGLIFAGGMMLNNQLKQGSPNFLK